MLFGRITARDSNVKHTTPTRGPTRTVRPVAAIGFAAILALLVGCTQADGNAPLSGSHAPPASMTETSDALAADISAILVNHEIGAAAVGIMRDGELVLELYHGTEIPTEPVDAATTFEIASVTKTAIAETALRLVAAGKLDLDEPLSDHWIDPDLAGDTRHTRLTPRLVLSHQTGFPNWRFFRSDGKLAFEREPGSGYTYSGEGFQYLGRALENKLGQPLPAIVERHLFAPLGMTSASIRNAPGSAPNFAMLRDEDGALFEKHCRPGFCFPEDAWNAAGLMTVTLRDYAKLLVAIGSGEGYSEALRQERDTVLTIKSEDRLVDCGGSAPTPCPDEQGYGLGLEVARTGDALLVGHGGFDWSTVSNAYIDAATGNGAIVFLTGPSDQGLQAMARLLDRIDPASAYAAHYRQWAARERAGEK